MQFTTTSYFLTLCLALFSMMSLVSALPIALQLENRDVYAPPVTYPHSGVVWKSGDKHSVKWDTSNPPKQITNTVGQIFLRKGDSTMSEPLADNFSILDGEHEITVPYVATGSDYRIVLIGDSGNWSQQFTIVE